MIAKALLAWWGLRAAPALHDTRVHDALNASAVAISGMRVVARQSMAVATAMASDPDDKARIDEGVGRMQATADAMRGNDVRAGLDELARRLD